MSSPNLTFCVSDTRWRQSPLFPLLETVKYREVTVAWQFLWSDSHFIMWSLIRFSSISRNSTTFLWIVYHSASWEPHCCRFNRGFLCLFFIRWRRRGERRERWTQRRRGSARRATRRDRPKPRRGASSTTWTTEVPTHWSNNQPEPGSEHKRSRLDRAPPPPSYTNTDVCNVYMVLKRLTDWLGSVHWSSSGNAPTHHLRTSSVLIRTVWQFTPLQLNVLSCKYGFRF